MNSTNGQTKNERPSTKRTAMLAALLAYGLSPRPALAHDPPVTLDAGTEQASNIAMTLAMMAIIGIAVYFATVFVAASYERRRKVVLDLKKMKRGACLISAGTMVSLWRIANPIPEASAAYMHVDKPQHGGQIQAVGNNHVELTLSPSGALALYVMGITENIAAPIAENTLWAQVSRVGTAPEKVMLHAAPQHGDPAGQASLFEGQLPKTVAGKAGTLSLSLPFEGQEQSVRFALGAQGGLAPVGVPAHDTSPVQVVASAVTPEEKKLYLTPGGAYTQADIAANGATTPEQKYAGMMANHHLNPKKGTYTCPITKTQANSKFAWIVNGQKYLFCCPPCIAEFVKEAKTDPHGIKLPRDYIQK